MTVINRFASQAKACAPLISYRYSLNLNPVLALEAPIQYLPGTVSQFQFSKQVALRYLWSKRSEAFITIISVISIVGVALGVMVLNIVMAVMSGFEHELRSKILGANSHIVVRSLSGRVTGWQEMMEKVSKVPDVVSVSPYSYNQALVRTNSSATGLIVRGILPTGAAADQVQSYLDSNVTVARLLDPPPVEVSADDGQLSTAKLPPLIIGRELARSAGLYTGSIVSLLSPSVTSTPFGLVPRFRRFVISGTYSSGLVEYESGLAYTSLPEAQAFFQLGDAVSGLEVRIKDIDHAGPVAKAILEAIGGVESGFYTQDWTESNKPLWEAIRLEKRVYFIVLLLIILMASFSIISTLVMIVLEKRRDIAVLRTLGATSKAVGNIFRIQGAVIGGLGVIFGLVGGYLGCIALRTYGFPLNEKVFQMSTLPIRIDVVNFAMVGVVAFAICFLATIYPARRASALREADLLRSE